MPKSKRKSSQLEWLECPVCLEVPRRGPIYGCKNGHMLCKDCQPKVNTCPICSEKEITCRNLIAEKVLESALQDHMLPCKFQEHGCEIKGILSFIESHEAYDCKFRRVACPGRKCGWQGPLVELTRHIRNNEEVCCRLLDPEQATHLFKWGLLNSVNSAQGRSVFSFTSEVHWSPILLLIDLACEEPQKNFCTFNFFRDGSGYWYAYVRALTKSKSNLRFEIRVHNRGDRKYQFSFIGDVAPSDDSEKKILKKGNYLMLRDDQVKILEEGKVLMDFTIRIFQE